MADYRTTTVAQLAHELTLAPARLRHVHIDNARKTVALLEPQRDYPRSFVLFHVTGFRTRRLDQDMELCGRDLIADLVLMIDQLSLQAPLPQPGETVGLHDARALCRRWSVSSKTLSRWRAIGLIAAWYARPQESARLLFDEQDVARFEALHAERVHRARTFRRLFDPERRALAARVLEIIGATRVNLMRAVEQVARETGRNAETIRMAVRKFGVTIAAAPTEIAENEPPLARRVRELSSQPLKYIFSPEFDHPQAEALIFAEPQDAADVSGESHTPPRDLPPYLQELYRIPLLSAAQEPALFRRYNYLMHRAEQARRLLDAALPSEAAVEHVESLLAQAQAIKNRITQANLRLVVAIARKHLGRIPGMDLFDLISEGNLTLIKAVESFDYTRGNRFSTYATWAVMRLFSRTAHEQRARRDRWQESGEEYRAAEQVASTEQARDLDELHAERSLQDVLAGLKPREREIVERRFGLADRPAQSLAEVSQAVSLSRERVRQIELRSLAKLRDALALRGIALSSA